MLKARERALALMNFDKALTVFTRCSDNEDCVFTRCSDNDACAQLACVATAPSVVLSRIGTLGRCDVRATRLAAHDSISKTML